MPSFLGKRGSLPHFTALVQLAKSLYTQDMEKELQNFAMNWVKATPETAAQLDPNVYSETRDIFQARLEYMTHTLLRQGGIPTEQVYLVAALAGEIGNNSFDHNLGKWKDVPGIFFDYNFSPDNHLTIALADRGQGIFTTLKKVKSSLTTDQEALETAFKEKLSGRAPENRGNGLKFVRKSVQNQHMHLTFYSGSAQAELNEQMVIKPSTDSIQGCLAILTL